MVLTLGWGGWICGVNLFTSSRSFSGLSFSERFFLPGSKFY